MYNIKYSYIVQLDLGILVTDRGRHTTKHSSLQNIETQSLQTFYSHLSKLEGPGVFY